MNLTRLTMEFFSDKIESSYQKSCEEEFCEELHATHVGIMKMKQLARRYVYWPKIDQDIEKLVRSCEECALIRSSPAKAPVHPWHEPDENWERLHMDYAGPFQHKYFLMVVDAKSKWAEVRIAKEAPSTASTMSLLQDIFSTHGYPAVLVSDNASIFTSEEFRQYCQKYGMSQKLIAPGHPATNGLAERNIQTLKRRLKTASNPRPLAYKLQDIMLNYRATPLACGRSPAELYLQRRLRMRLDAIKPNITSNYLPPCETVRQFQVGERVQARIHFNNQDTWQFGHILKKLGYRHYIVKLDSGKTKDTWTRFAPHRSPRR
nr:unnamed protein product [Callosobruchus chinensis]